jgi:hypothetical protein
MRRFLTLVPGEGSNRALNSALSRAAAIAGNGSD